MDDRQAVADGRSSARCAASVAQARSLTWLPQAVGGAGTEVCMEARSLKFIATACAGELLSGSPETLVHRVCTDSRQAQAGDLFFALPGERFDGHDFLREAAEKGAGAVVVERRARARATGAAAR